MLLEIGRNCLQKQIKGYKCRAISQGMVRWGRECSSGEICLFSLRPLDTINLGFSGNKLWDLVLCVGSFGGSAIKAWGEEGLQQRPQLTPTLTGSWKALPGHPDKELGLYVSAHPFNYSLDIGHPQEEFDLGSGGFFSEGSSANTPSSWHNRPSTLKGDLGTMWRWKLCECCI